tara:strand:- start:1886 stop:2320 length:435 start_codon:yes stop_codon:yes gene_type:complete
MMCEQETAWEKDTLATSSSETIFAATRRLLFGTLKTKERFEVGKMHSFPLLQSLLHKEYLSDIREHATEIGVENACRRAERVSDSDAMRSSQPFVCDEAIFIVVNVGHGHGLKVSDTSKLGAAFTSTPNLYHSSRCNKFKDAWR